MAEKRKKQEIEADLKVTRSSGNVFRDLGFENPEEELAKAKLVYALRRVIEERALTQVKVAKALRIDQPTVSKLLRGHTEGITADRLIRLLNLMGQDVDISVRPKRSEEAKVTVSVAQMM